MIVGVSVAVFLVVTMSLVSSGSVTRKDQGFFQCAGYCKGTNKFKYTPGLTYIYDYTANTRTYIRGSTKEKSELHLSASVYIYAVTYCDLVLQLKDVELTDSHNKKSTEFSTALEKHSLHFSFQDGSVEELCPSDDPLWVLNVKRGILSAFQNTMHDLHSAREKRHETDVSGTCETKYDVILQEDSTNNPILYIGKMKNLQACSNRRAHFLSVQSSPYASSGAQSLPLIKSEQRGSQIVKDNILQKATNNEIHTFRPFSKHESGAVTMVNQILQFRTTDNKGALQESSPVRRTTLLYEYPEVIPGENNIQTVRELLQELKTITQSGVESSVPSVFSQLIQGLTSLPSSEISKLYTEATDKNIRKFILDSLPYVATNDGIKVMAEFLKYGEISPEQMDSWFTSLAFQKKPTIDMLSSLSNLLDKATSPKGLLSISALVHSYCQQNTNCVEEDTVIQLMEKIELLLGLNCESNDEAAQKLTVLALKAIGNAGIFTGSDYTLKKCLKVGNPIEVRLAAISAYRRLPCSERSRSHLLELYTNRNQDTELRIAAYLAVMQCPTSSIIHKIKDTLYGEEVNQVASFVWTHLTNLQETSSPWKQSIRKLVSSDFLRNKFKTDVRKFSRNYEGSFFSDALNAGAAIESNIIFTPQSYLPRSANLNLTLDMFGETVNILDIGVRAKGIEQIMENLFGPGGYFPDGPVSKMIKNLQDKGDKDSIENSISQLADQFDAKSKVEKDLYASVYTRIFGNEIQYSEFHGLKDLLTTLKDIPTFDIMRNISQVGNIDFTKSFVIVDGLYSIPTGVGLPMNLNLNGTAALSFKMQGHVNIKDLFQLNSIEVEGSIMPSAAVGFTATMAVDAAVTRAGIRLVNTLHTNTYIDGKAKIQGRNLIELQLNVPRDKTEILDISSQIFILHSGQYFESKGIEENTENYKLCSAEFLTSLTGMRSCMELTYVNTSLQPGTPYFPLTGPFRFRIDIAKIDTFSAYVLIFKQQKEESLHRQETSLSFHFDTPGSKVDRKLSAQYKIDWKNSILKASLISPIIQVSANAKAENSDNTKSLDASISINDHEILTTRLGLRKFRKEQTGRYEPFFSLSYRKQIIADITGKIIYIESLKYNADFLIKGITKDPISISGDFNANSDTCEVFAHIKSKLLTSSLHINLRSTDSYVSAKATVSYRIKSSPENTLDFSAKLQDLSKGALTRESLYITLQMSQFPQYDVEVQWDIQHSPQFLENNAKLVVGDITWQTRQLYLYISTHSSAEIALLSTLTCDILQIDYGVDFLYKATNQSISTHLITRVTPQYKLSASLNYMHRLNQHNLDLDVKSPWYNTGLTSTLIENIPGRHEIEFSSWWSQENHLNSLNASGFYSDGSNRIKTEHLLDLTLCGSLNGKLSMGIASTSSSNNQWMQIEIDNEIYLVNATYIRDVFHFVEGTLKLGNSSYSGSLVLLSTAIEKGFAIDLKLRKRLTMATKVTCDGEKHGLQVELFWDKDTNPSKKISLMAQAMGNRKEVLLEMPGRYLKGEVVTIPSGVVGLLEWAEHQKISAHLEWNLDEGSAEITVKLKTPFQSMESVSLFATYTMLENEGIFVVDGSWQKEKLTLTATVRRNDSISGSAGIKLITHLESTIPSLEHLSLNFDHISYVNEKLGFKSVAFLKYNDKQSDFEANLSYNESSLYADIMMISPIQNLQYMKHILQYKKTQEDIAGSLELKWTEENKINGEFFIKTAPGASGAFRIVTPFKGYETTSFGYNFTKFQDLNGNIRVIMEASAVYNQHVGKIDISASKLESSFGGNLHLKTPFTEDLKLNILHSLEKGKLNEFLIVNLAQKQLFQLFLDAEINSISNLLLSGGAVMPNLDMKISVRSLVHQGNLKFYYETKLNDKNISVTAVGKCENSKEGLLVQFDCVMTGSVVPKELKLYLNHSSVGRISKTNLQLPYNIFLTNVLTINTALNWNNRLLFRTPIKSLTIENEQSCNNFTLNHTMNFDYNDQLASAVIYFVKDEKYVIREAKAHLTTPWSEPITIEYVLPTDNLLLKPSITLKFKKNMEIKIESEVKFQMCDSTLYAKITSPFQKSIIFYTSFQLGGKNLSSQLSIQWDAKKINGKATAEFEPSLMNASGEFYIRYSEVNGDIVSGKFKYNIDNPEMTAHVLGIFKTYKTEFISSLRTTDNAYKGAVSIQTPFSNWEHLSLSGEVILKPACATETEHRDVNFPKFSISLEGNIYDYHIFSFFGEYNVLIPNKHVLNVTCEYNDKRIELLSELQRDNKSLLNSVKAECNLKTPFEKYNSLSAYGSYDIKGIDKKLNFYLIRNNQEFMVDSLVSFQTDKGNSHIRVKLPFQHLKEMSTSVRYGFNPTTHERTINIKITHNNLTVDVLGALLVTDSGSMTAGLEVTSPVVGFKNLKCSATLSAAKGHQKSATIVFSKEHDDYAITGMFVNNTDARVIVTTPLKGYEKIETNIGYEINKNKHFNSGIKINVYANLKMPTCENVINFDIDTQKLNSTTSIILLIPSLQVPQTEIHVKHDVRSFPASFTMLVSKNMTKFISLQVILENNRLSGEIFTPIDGYKNIAISGSLKFQKEKNIIYLDGILGKHFFQASSSLALSILTSEVKAEINSDFPGIEKISLHGQYDIQNYEKSAFLSIMMNPNKTYELLVTGSVTANTGSFRVQMYLPEDNTLLFIGKYNLKNDNSVSFAMDENGEKYNFDGYIVFTADGIVIRIETPFEEAKDISLYARYYTESDEHSAQLKITRNIHTVLLNSSFNFQNNTAIIQLQTPYEFMRNLIIDAEISGIMNGESNITFNILRNSEHVLKTSSYFVVDWENKIETNIGFDSIFLPYEFKNLHFYMSLNPSFPPSELRMIAVKQDSIFFKLESNVDIIPKGFTYNLALRYQLEVLKEWSVSIDYYPENTLIRGSIGVKSAGHLKKYEGELRIDRSIGEISAFFKTPILGYESFSIKIKKDNNITHFELVLPFKYFEHTGFSVNYEFQPERKSGSLLVWNNKNKIEFKASLECLKDDYKMNLLISTPFPRLKKFNLQIQYMNPEIKKVMNINITANDVSFELTTEITVEPNVLKTKLDTYSNAALIQNVSLVIFYDKNMNDALILGGKLKVGELSGNITISVQYDLWKGELFASFSNENGRIERKIRWTVKNDKEIMSAMVAVNLGHKFNFVFNGFLKSIFFKDFESQLTFTIFPNRKVYSMQLKWNATNIVDFYADLSVSSNGITAYSLSGNIDVDNTTNINMVSFEYLILPFGKSKIRIEYLLMNDTSAEIRYEISLNEWNLVGSVSFSLYKGNTTMKCNSSQGHVHFQATYDLTTQFKLFDLKYQRKYHYYAANANITLQNSLFPLITLRLKTPEKYYSFLKFSNQYTINSTHVGMKITLEKEKNKGEISLLLWKQRKSFGFDGYLAIPLENFKTWHTIVSVDMTPEFSGIINVIKNYSDFFSAQIQLSSGTIKLNNETIINKKGFISLKWEENSVLLNGSVKLNKNNISEISLLFASPWTKNFGFIGRYKNKQSTINIIKGSEIIQVEGYLKYMIQDLKMNIEFSSKLGNQKLLLKADYDFLTPVKETNLNIQFGSSSLQGSGLLNKQKMSGNLHINTSFNFLKKVMIEGEYNFNSSLKLVLNFNDKIFNFSEEHNFKSNSLNGSFTLVSPFLTLYDTQFRIFCDIASTDIKIENSNKSLYLYYNHAFENNIYSVQSKMNISTVPALENVLFSADIDIKNISASVIMQWKSSKSLNLSITIVPENISILLETPFKDLERILAKGFFKNEGYQLIFIGNVQTGNKDTAHVNIKIDTINFGQMEHYLYIGISSRQEISFTLTFQPTDSKSDTALTVNIDRDSDLIIKGVLNLKDLVMNLKIKSLDLINFALDSSVTFRIWEEVKINSNIIYADREFKLKGSYFISNKHLNSELSITTPNMNSSASCGFNVNNGTEVKLNVNKEQLLISYQINSTSFIGNIKFIGKITGINNFSLLVRGMYKPALLGLLAYEYNEYSGTVSFYMNEKETTTLIKGRVNLRPFYIPMNHTITIILNKMTTQNSIEFMYESNACHKIKISCNIEEDYLKIKTIINSKIFGDQEIVLFTRNWKVMQIDILNILSSGWKINNSDALFFLNYLQMKNSLVFQIENNDDFEGQFIFISPYLSNGKINITIKSETHNLNTLLEVKYMNGINAYIAALETITSSESKMATIKIITPTTMVLNYNINFLINEKIILVETSLNIMNTLSVGTFKWNRDALTNTELFISSPYLPQKTAQLIINVNNSGILLHAGHGDTATGQYIIVQGTLNQQEGEVNFSYKIPITHFVQFLIFKGNFKFDSEGAFRLGLASHFSSQSIPSTELSMHIVLSLSEIKLSTKCWPPGQNDKIYEGILHIPFAFSNNMKPTFSINFGNNHTYGMDITYVNLKDNQEMGFGIQYKLRKLGAALKIEKNPNSGIQADINLPIGDNTGHYGVYFKTEELFNLMNVGNVIRNNHTKIGIAWGKNHIELSYSLSHSFNTMAKLFNNEENLQCMMMLQLRTPFAGYEQNGLQMYIDLSSTYGIILTSLHFPGSERPLVIELNYELKNHNYATLTVQLQLPFIPSLEDIAIVISNKIDEEYRQFRSFLGGHWNKEKLSIHVEGSLTEEIVLKASTICHLFGETYSISIDFGSSDVGLYSHYIVRAHVSTPLLFLENTELCIKIDLMKSLLINLMNNNKELFGLEVYTNKTTILEVDIRNPWKCAYFLLGYDITKDIMVQTEISWNMAQLNKQKLGMIFYLTYGPDDRKQISFTLKLPTRILVLNLTQQQSPIKTEYAAIFSWEKGQIIGFRGILNVNRSNEFLAFNTVARVDFPCRSFELLSYGSAQLEAMHVKYTDMGVEFMWDAFSNRSKRIGIELKQLKPYFEITLKHPALQNDPKIRFMQTGVLFHNELPFKMKIEIEYSSRKDELITVETFMQQLSKTHLLLDMGFSICHLPSSLEFNMRSEIGHTPSDNHAKVLAEYLDSHTGQMHRLELMGKISLLRPEMEISVKTAENLLKAYSLFQTDNNSAYSLYVEVIMNQKEPLKLKACITMQEPMIELTAHYGNSHSYKAYAEIPNYREINFGIKHLLYENEYDDLVVILQLNTSQLLWSRVKWQPRALTEFKSSFFEEYADILHVIQNIGSGYFEVWLKDVAYKYNYFHTKLVNNFDLVVSTSISEVDAVYKNFMQMGNDMIIMYRNNDFYLQDIQPYANKIISYIKDTISGTWKVLFYGMESLCLVVRDIVMMITNTLQIDSSRISAFFNEIKVIAGKTITCVMKSIKEIKQLHTSAKEALKLKLEAARLLLVQTEKNMEEIISSIKHYIHELITSYVELLEPYLMYFENTMELLSRRVIDFEDEISEYVLEMVDNILGAEEVRELIDIYNTYAIWLEELHLQEYIDKMYKFQESIVKLIMSDIRRICADYNDYVDYAVKMLNDIYKNINTMPAITYTKQALIIVYEKAKWIWQHYELCELVKHQVHSCIDNLDKILLQLLNAIDMDASSPTKSLTPSIILRPDIGFIEYSQKLPIDWNGFNELPKFEQLQLYEQAKDHANEIASLEKYRYFLMDTFYDITSNMSIASLMPPFSATGMVIGKQHYITFDKKFYNFAGECSYLLASDFLNNKFSVYVTYTRLQGEEMMRSLTVLIGQHHIEISSNKYVTVDNQKIELPMEVTEGTLIRRTENRVTVQSDLGIQVECNLYYDFCSIELSGWYFGKTGGLLGTFDYEPTNDLQFPNGTTANTVEDFTSSWRIASKHCHSMNHATPTDIKHNEVSDVTFESKQCTAYFGQLSPLRPCFSRIDVQPYMQMCLSEINHNQDALCLHVAAYVSQCRRKGVDVVMPHKCVHCQSSDGHTMNASELKVYDGMESKLADIVFVVEQASCLKSINLVEVLSKLDRAMSTQGYDTQYSVVDFNGKEFSEPNSRTAGGEIWSSKTGTEKVLRSLQSVISKHPDTGKQHAFSALWHASHLHFRGTASKTIILIQCTSCTDSEDDYSDLITVLLEKDITLHILQPDALKLRSGLGKTSKVYGVDLNGAFSGRNLKTLVPSLPLLRQVELPKDLCTPLALETNGTLFNMDRLLQNDSNKINVKRFLDIWARRINLTAKPSLCQKCQCMANQDGVGQIMCSKCLSPTTEQYLKEWENLKLENLSSQKGNDEYLNLPL